MTGRLCLCLCFQLLRSCFRITSRAYDLVSSERITSGRFKLFHSWNSMIRSPWRSIPERPGKGAKHGDRFIHTTYCKSDKTEEMVKTPNRRRKSSKNMGPNFFGCPDSTPARGPESGSFPRATPVGTCMERCRRQWRRTRHSRS